MISVIMPAYNAEKFISTAIESILNQTFQEFEFIIIDDGSTDSTWEILERYAAADEKVKIIKIQHSGISSALNVGIDRSRYSWIARMDADDVALPERLEKQISAAQSNSELVVLGTYAYHVNGRGEVLSLSATGPTTKEKFYNLQEDGKHVNVIHPTALIRKDALVEAGKYNPNFDYCEDLELFDRLSQKGLILALPEPLLLYRLHKASISMKHFSKMSELTRYITARRKVRLFEFRELPLEEFLQKKSRLSHLKTSFGDLNKFCYRKAGLLFGEKHYLEACLYFSMSLVLNPMYSAPRVWRQLISPNTRRWLKKDT